MSIILRVLLILFSIGALAFIVAKIRKAQMQIESAIVWIVLMFGFVLFGCFPGIVTFFSVLIGVESPANLVFVGVIFILLIIVFNLSLKVSKLQFQIKQLTQITVIEEKQKKEPQDNG